MVLASLGSDGENCQTAAMVVPVEGHVGGRGGDKVAMGEVGPQRQLADHMVRLGCDGRRVLVFAGLETPSHPADAADASVNSINAITFLQH